MEKQKLSARNQAIATAKAELEASQLWLENIPLDAEWSDIAKHQIVAQHWPARIEGLVANR